MLNKFSPVFVVPKPTTNANAVPTTTTNHVNRNELVLKNLAFEASQWTNYNWSAIQEAEAKYQIYLASQRKVCKVWPYQNLYCSSSKSS